jgi:hypothetical protein
MASPPYTIATTTPADTDIMSIFPGQERPYRDTVWSWLNQIAFASTGLLNPAAFPSFVNGWVIQAASGVVDATLSFKDNSGVLQSLVLWDHTGDQLSLVGYADDGVTARTRLDIKGDTAVVNVSLGALQVGGVAVVLPTYSGAISGLTGVGALTSGSIGGSFGSINIGANSLTAGAATLASVASSGAVSGTTGTFSSNVSGVNATFTGTVTANQNIQSSTAALVLGTTGAGTTYLRPNGVGSATGQFYVASNGNVTSSGDITANSDRRLKTSISPLNHQWANDMVREVQPMTFIWKRKGHERGIGFIAQDVEGYAPELVHADDRGIRSLAYPNMVAILWAVVQDLQKKVEELSQ